MSVYNLLALRLSEQSLVNNWYKKQHFAEIFVSRIYRDEMKIENFLHYGQTLIIFLSIQRILQSNR